MTYYSFVPSSDGSRCAGCWWSAVMMRDSRRPPSVAFWVLLRRGMGISQRVLYLEKKMAAKKKRNGFVDLVRCLALSFADRIGKKRSRKVGTQC